MNKRERAAQKRAAEQFDKRLGKRIHELRTARGDAVAKLADAIGRSESQVHRYETGFSFVQPFILVCIAEFFGKTVDELLAEAQ
jgi:transcriptional regulator with XRE-family HTH domain